MLRWLSGEKPPNQLADARLEALRRYAVSFRLSGGLIDPRAEAICAGFGYSDETLLGVEQLVRDGVPDLDHAVRRPGPMALIATGAAFLGVLLWLAAELDDVAAALIVAGLGAVLLLSLAAGGSVRSTNPGGAA